MRRKPPRRQVDQAALNPGVDNRETPQTRGLLGERSVNERLSQKFEGGCGVFHVDVLPDRGTFSPEFLKFFFGNKGVATFSTETAPRHDLSQTTLAEL
jgi:hypothetical protein